MNSLALAARCEACQALGRAWRCVVSSVVLACVRGQLRGQLEELRETARHGTEEVRGIARRLRPDVLDELGLQSALAALAGAFERQARVRVVRHLERVVSASPEAELVIYRVAQEAMTNIARHAGASWAGDA